MAASQDRFVARAVLPVQQTIMLTCRRSCSQVKQAQGDNVTIAVATADAQGRRAGEAIKVEQGGGVAKRKRTRETRPCSLNDQGWRNKLRNANGVSNDIQKVDRRPSEKALNHQQNLATTLFDKF